MKLKAVIAVLTIALCVALNACKTCDECKFVITDIATDTLVGESRYSQACGSKQDLKGLKEACDLTASESSKDSIRLYTCSCSELE